MSKSPSPTPPALTPATNANTRPEALKVYDVPWEDTDVQAFRDYLLRNPRFLIYLGSRVPRIYGETMEAVAMSGKKHDGYEECFGVIQSMTEGAAKSEQSPYSEGGENGGSL